MADSKNSQRTPMVMEKHMENRQTNNGESLTLLELLKQIHKRKADSSGKKSRNSMQCSVPSLV